MFKKILTTIVFMMVITAPAAALALGKPATSMVLNGASIPLEYSGGIARNQTDTQSWMPTGRQGIGKVSVEMHLGTLGSENVTSPIVPDQHLQSYYLTGTRFDVASYMTPNAPGGAFGWMTPEQERWYGNMRWNYTTLFRGIVDAPKSWYRNRKFLVTNLTTGRMVVCNAGDYGPGVGSRIGGLSPDVMYWISNQTKLMDYDPNSPTTSVGYDPSTDYMFEWVLDESTPLGPISNGLDGIPTNIAIYKMSTTKLAYVQMFPITGKLTGVHGSAQKIVLQRSSDNINWSNYTIATTDGEGNFSISTPVDRLRYYRIKYSGNGIYAPVNSKSISLISKAYFSSISLPSRVYYHRYFTFSVLLKPLHASGSTAVKFYLQRYEKQSNGTYKWITKFTPQPAIYTYSSTTSKARYRLELKQRGSWRIYAYHSDANHSPTKSTIKYFRVY